MHPDFEFKRVPISAVKDKQLSQISREALTNIGLPGFVSPHLYFGDFEDNQLLPSLSSWSWGTEWEGNLQKAIMNFDNCYVIGCGQESEPILIKPNYDSIYQVHNNGEELIFINSDLNKLYTSLNAFLIMVEEALMNDTKALIEQRIPALLFSKFKRQLSSIDHAATKDTALWISLVEGCGHFYNDV